MIPRLISSWLLLLSFCSLAFGAEAHSPAGKHFLYVAVPGIRDYLQYGGHGLLVFDIDHGHKFVKRIAIPGLDEKGKPLNVKGICISGPLRRAFISTLRTMVCVDLAEEKVLWEKPYKDGCDRMSISPNGKTIYLPTLERDHWAVVDASSGNVMTNVITKSGAHNTLYGPDGKFVYLAGLKSPLLNVAQTQEHTLVEPVGPFSAPVRPFTINQNQTLCFVNVNDLLGFEIGDLKTGKKLHRVEVQGFQKGPVERHGCPSHGIGLTPDEKEIWVCDAFNRRLHIFDATQMPPKQLESIKVSEQPGWVTFSMDGKYAYPSTGEVIEVKTRKIVSRLQDETGAFVNSEKMVEGIWNDDGSLAAGNQFGIGRAAVSPLAKQPGA
jgi:hypothetical protein